MITACRIEGRYKGYIVKKAVLTDHLHYPEKDYIAILAQKIVDQNSAETKECIFEPDERVEAFMLEWRPPLWCYSLYFYYNLTQNQASILLLLRPYLPFDELGLGGSKVLFNSLQFS